MSDRNVYVRPNLVFEPLVNNWYAWSHLISPATLAMNIAGRHLPIVESYLMAPELHEEAVLNPKMRGGPFMDVDRQRLDEIRELREMTFRERGKLIKFATAVKELDKLLLAEAKGYGLEALYPKVPPILRGFVELVYDRNNNPDFRFFESLLFKSEYYEMNAQSMAFWITNNDHRPFCLSTPRLDDTHVLHLNISFDHPGIDELARMKRECRPLSEIKESLRICSKEIPIFESFFTEIAPPLYNKYCGDKIRMRYFGHACILIETKNVSILVDPLISYYGYHSDIEHYSDADLPDFIDYLLITHNHQDHILFETLLPLRHKTGQLIVPRTCSGKLEDPDLKLMFEHTGFRNIRALDEMESISIEEVTITGLPFIGEHSDLNIRTKSCYLIEIGEFKLLFLADSRVLEPLLYQRIHDQIGDVDVLFLGMECDGAPLTWLYGPLLTRPIPKDQDGSRRLAGSDCAKGMFLVDIFKPKEVYVYAMGQEPWVEFISSIKYTDESNPIVQSDKLIELCRSKGMVAERLFGEKELLYDKRNTFI
jgi:L-ascorbate metabolism protein UlaG (beta-lactamase superfamily)